MGISVHVQVNVYIYNLHFMLYLYEIMFDIALAIYNSKVIYDHPKCPSERTLVKINASYPFH